MSQSERRKYPRLSINVEVEYTLLKRASLQLKSAQSKNISAGGICIILLEKLEVGTPLEFKFSLPGYDRIIKCEGRIAWLQEFLIGENNSISGYNAGVEFSNISEEDRNKINEYVAGKVL